MYLGITILYSLFHINDMARILIFGDSITWGYHDKEGGWVQRLRNFLYEKMLLDSDFDYPIYNLGISGDTTEDVLERFEFETKQRRKENEKVIIIFGIGVNDSQFFINKKELRIPPEKTKENIQKLIKLSKKFTEKIIFVGLTPVDESKVIPVPWRTEISYKNEYIQEYNEIIKFICKENKINFIEIFEKWTKFNYKKLLEDGAHPNSEGHEKIFEVVKEFLIKNKII